MHGGGWLATHPYRPRVRIGDVRHIRAYADIYGPADPRIGWSATLGGDTDAQATARTICPRFLGATT